MDKSMMSSLDTPSNTEHEQSDNEQYKKKLPFKVVLVIGPPGAGKGTLCRKHPVEFGYYHFSVGDYLRDLCNKPNDFPAAARADLKPQELATNMKEAKLLPAEAMVKIMRFKLEQEYAKGCFKFFIDGFPRTLDSAKLFDEEIGKPSQVVFVYCPKPVAKSRFLSRAREESDDGEKFEARYAQYKEESRPIRGWYELLLKEVNNGDGEDEAHQAVLEILKRLDFGFKQT